MAVLAHFQNPPVTFLDHKQYLTDLYCRDVGYVPKDIFEIKTPFRMDLEADKIAETISKHKEDSSHSTTQTPKRDRKKKKRINLTSENDIDEAKKISQSILQSLAYIKDFRPELFGENPTVEEIRENNRPVRNLVQSIHMSTRDIKCPLQDENSDVNKSKVVNIQGSM